jgi:hypothetical protein
VLKEPELEATLLTAADDKNLDASNAPGLATVSAEDAAVVTAAAHEKRTRTGNTVCSF